MAHIPRDRRKVHHHTITVLAELPDTLQGYHRQAFGLYFTGMTIEDLVVACEEARLGGSMRSITFAKRCIRRDCRAGRIKVEGPGSEELRQYRPKKLPTYSRPRA